MEESWDLADTTTEAALSILSDDGEGWMMVSRRGKKKTDEKIAGEFWAEIGYPTPASRF